MHSNGNSFVFNGNSSFGVRMFEGALKLAPNLGVFSVHPVQQTGNAL